MTATEELSRLTKQLATDVAEHNWPNIPKTAHTLQGTLRVFQNEQASMLLNKLQAHGASAKEIISAQKKLEPILAQILDEITAYQTKVQRM